MEPPPSTLAAPARAGTLDDQMVTSLKRLCAVGLGLSAINVMSSILMQQPGARFWADMIVAVGIVGSFIGGWLLSRQARLLLASRVVSVGVVASILVGDLWLGQITDKLWFLTIGVMLAGFGLNHRQLWAVCALAVAGLVALVGLLPHHPLGTPCNPMQVMDVGVLMVGVSFFLSVTIRASLAEQARAVARQLESEEQRALAEQAAAQAQVASDSKSMFLANVSHELRTPLNAIIGYAELIMEEAADLGVVEFDEDLSRVSAAATHLRRLIDDVLDLSRIEAGRMELELEEVALGPLLGELVQVSMPLARQRQNQLTLVLGESDQVVLRTDRTRLRQIVLNLLSNACKFTERGQVTLSAREALWRGRPGVLIEVRDTGVGMTPEELLRAFEVFVQASASTSRQHGGSGLGLPLTRRICGLLGGELDAQSEPGQGSVFRVTLPLDPAQP